MRCLEREPEKRFQNPRDVVRALTAVDAPTETLITPGPRPIGFAGSRAAMATIAVLALIVLSLAGVWILGRHRPPADAIRWYEEGARALRDGTSFTAMKAFERAVKLDSDFTLAHARLAEAATELDYMDKAKSEMLLAYPPAYQSWFLSADEKLRLQAVYFTLVKDFGRAAAAYKGFSGEGRKGRAARRSGRPGPRL
jgi:hypothetical protein